MKPIEVKDNTYIHSIKEFDDKDLKFKFRDHLRILKYKNVFAKEHTPNCSEEVKKVKEVKEVKNTVSWTYLSMISMVKELLKHFMKKNYKKQINKDLDNSFNSWIDKKDLIE